MLNQHSIWFSQLACVGVIVRSRLKKYRTRLFLHLGMLRQQGRWRYLARISRGVAERIRDRLLRIPYKAFPGWEKPLPRAIRTVREAGVFASRQYRPAPYDVRVTLFRAAVGTIVPDVADPGMGWERLALGGVQVHEVPGDHNHMYVEPHIRVLVESLRGCLERAHRETSAHMKTGAPIRVSA